MIRNLSQKLSFRLFLWGIALVPFATVADAVLDAVLFKQGDISGQLLFPSDHELATRVLVSIFILGAIYLGMHFLANASKKERQLQQRNKDLLLARQDLETLHETISCQLRNSSTEVATSLELLKDQCHEIDEKVQFFIEKIHLSSDKLQEHLEINQALAEHTFGEPYREQVRIDKLAIDVAQRVKQEHPDRQIEFNVQPWVHCWCDKRMLQQIIYNLFINALSFIPSSREGRIEFGMINRSNQRVLFVRDNGTGYSKAQAERIFEPFRDTSQDPELPTDTTLLANTRRLIHRHNGQAWAEGIEGAGGTIFFTYYNDFT